MQMILLCHWLQPKAIGIWSPSAIARNLSWHIIFGNRLSADAKAMLYATAREERRTAKHGSLTRALNRCRMEGFDMTRQTAANWVRRWEADGWRFDVKERSRRQSEPRKLSAAGVRKLVKAAAGNNARETARFHTFSMRRGGTNAVSHTTVIRWARRGGLVLAVPKQRRIRFHFDHHRRMRVIHCEWVASLPVDEAQAFCYSDEQGWPVTLGANRKNDVIFVERGQQATSNITRRTKGDGSTCFSLWWAISRSGVVAFELYEGTLTVEKFHKLLRDKLAPALRKREREGAPITHFFHDHVTNSARLFDADTMNDAIGDGRWLQHAPQGCRVDNGHIWIEQTAKRRGHFRRSTVPAPVCECEVKEGDIVPSASPELNLAESAQGYLRRLVRRKVLAGRRWSGRVSNKMAIVGDVVQALDRDKRYWIKLFDSIQPRARKVVETDGKLLSL